MCDNNQRSEYIHEHATTNFTEYTAYIIDISSFGDGERFAEVKLSIVGANSKEIVVKALWATWPHRGLVHDRVLDSAAVTLKWKDMRRSMMRSGTGQFMTIWSNWYQIKACSVKKKY